MSNHKRSIVESKGAKGLSTWKYGLLVAGLAPVMAGSALAGDPTPERLWSHVLTGESYYKHTVSIGNHGSQVFCDTGYFSQNTRLYSSTDELGSPVWENYNPALSLLRVADSSDSNDVHAVWRQELSSTGGNIAKTYIYRSDSSSPLATYSFSTTENSNGNGACTVSDNGRWVTAATSVHTTVRLVRFDLMSSNPGAPGPELLINHFGAVTDYHSSSDGSRLYLGGQTSGLIYDFSKGEIIFDNIYWEAAEPRGHSFSGDGRTIVVPQDGKTAIYRENSSGFSKLLEFAPFPSSSLEFPWASAISEDGDIIVAAYAIKPTYLNYHVFAWRVSTGEQLLHHFEQGSGDYDNVPNKICISNSGDRFVVGSSGDENGQSPELQVFQLNSQGSAYQQSSAFNLPGSIYDMDLSGDGYHLAVSGRTAHQNSGTGSKVIEAFDLGTDFRVTGNPGEGDKINFEFTPSQAAGIGYLLASDNLSSNPAFSIGTLYLERLSMTLLPMDTPDAGGVLKLSNYSVEGSPGTTKYYQGYALDQRELSDTWVPVTTLP